MAETKLARLTAHEVDALHILRSMSPTDQEIWVDIGQRMLLARNPIEQPSATVILLADPLRKFPHRSSG